MEECIFCKIARGEIPVTAVYADDHVIAFDDISPQAPVHTLVIPRDHFADMSVNIPDELMAALFSAVREVARRKGVAETGYRVIVNSGPDANQTVPHLHVHVMGGRSMSHGMVAFAEE